MYNTFYLRIYHTEIDNIRQCLKCFTKKCTLILLLVTHFAQLSSLGVLLYLLSSIFMGNIPNRNLAIIDLWLRFRISLQYSSSSS